MGQDSKKIEFEFEKKSPNSSLIGSAPVVCAFFPDFMHGYIAKSKPECLKKESQV